MKQCNNAIEKTRLSEEPLFQGHTFHYIGVWIAGAFAITALVLSLLQILLHANYYSKPHEQKNIIRILFMVPVYAVISALSFRYYNYYIYLGVIRDCYEAFAIASFFSLLCSYIAPDLNRQKEYFRSITVRPWIFPVNLFSKCCGGQRGPWRTPRSGLTWFNIIWTCVFQYCAVKVCLALTALITQATGRYCIESLSPEFAHIWIIIVQVLSVTCAMHCLIQFYHQIKETIAPNSPLMKLTAIKLVIFLSFWQTILLSILSGKKVIKAGPHLQEPDIRVGLPAMLLCVEMAIFSVFHFWSFPFQVYRIGSMDMERTSGSDGPLRYQGGPLGIKALIEALNPWDFVKAFGRAVRWVVKGRKDRHHDRSYDVALGRKPTGETLSQSSSTKFENASNVSLVAKQGKVTTRYSASELPTVTVDAPGGGQRI